MLQGRWWKQALHLVGSVQDNMDVRVEATKAALCLTMGSEWLCWQAHIDRYCLEIHGTRSTLTPPQCHMNSSRCVECASQEGKHSFTPRKRGKKLAVVLSPCYLGFTTSVLSQGIRPAPRIYLCKLKLAVQLSYHLLHPDMKNLHWAVRINIDPELTMEVSILRINPNS